MRTNRVHALAVKWLTLGVVCPALAQPLAQQSFDFELHGDDPGEVFPFSLPPDSLTPVVVRFDGGFQNLVGDATSVRYDLWWSTADGGGFAGNVGPGFIPLPGSGQLSLSFAHSIGFTPATVFFLVEGGGPDDHFRFTGDLAIQPVPEPGVVPLLCVGITAGRLWRRLERARAHAGPCAAPNGGPATQRVNSGVTDGPPSVR